MLTAIAVSLAVIATRDVLPNSAYAQMGSDCGSASHRPCYITTPPGGLFGKPIEVKIVDR
jgi:hypothetical protein